MIGQTRQKGSRRLLAKIAITGVLAAVPMAVVAAPAFADPAPGGAQTDQDWQHNQGQGQDWQHNQGQGQDWQHNGDRDQGWQHNGDRDQGWQHNGDRDQGWQHNGDRDQQRDHDQDGRNNNQWQNWRPDQH